MKKIILCIFLFTTCLFANNYDDMFNELEGVTSFIILDAQTKNTIEGAKIEISDLSNFSNAKGITEYKASEDEILEEQTLNFNITKSGYIKYQGKVKVGEVKKRIYLEKDNINKTFKKQKVYENKVVSKDEVVNKNKKILTSKVRILALEDGTIYLSDKKLRNIRSSRESFFRIKEGNRVLTLDTKKAVYRKNINITAPEMLVVFNEGDIIKIKEAKKTVLPVKKIEPVVKVAITNPVKTEKKIKEITNDYLISEIVKPLEDGNAFEITTKVSYFEMEEDEDKGNFVIYKTPEGKTGNMDEESIRRSKRNIGNNELLDDYYYITSTFQIRLKKEYIEKVMELFKEISIENQEYLSANANWNTESKGQYILISNKSNINDDIIKKLYRVSYKKTKKYNKFFNNLDQAIKRQREYRIRLFDKNSSIVVFNMKINGYQSHNSVKTNLGNKEIFSGYSSMGRYLDRLNYNLLGSLYTEDNEYYFLENTVATIDVKILKKNDGRKIIKSDYKLVR